MWERLFNDIQSGSILALSRCISLVENEAMGYSDFLENLPPSSKKIIGITGPPGAGKSTLIDGLINEIVQQGKRVGVICIDPSSPFSMGALLGDRIRMNKWHNNPQVYVRSLASRGSLGGLNPKIFEITDVMKLAPFDYYIIETVGVGQNEIEIAGIADTTIVVVVPESGDEVQTMKAGLMEIADIFVVNKSDRPDAESFVRNLLALRNLQHSSTFPEIIKTVALNNTGIPELLQLIETNQQYIQQSDKRFTILADKAFYLIQKQRMKDINKMKLKAEIQQNEVVNLYKFIKTYI